jgi:hypothetical protein
MLANEHQSGFDQRLYIFLRYTDKQRILVVTNFSRSERSVSVKLSNDLLERFNLTGSVMFTDLLSGVSFNTNNISEGVPLMLRASSGLLLQF